MSPNHNHLLPPNATTAEEKALSLAAIALNILPEDIKSLWQPYTCHARFLPFLAWGMHVDFWRDTLPEPTKRALIAGSVEWHRHKGTPWAVKQGLTVLGIDATIYEWWQTTSILGTTLPPCTFAVEALLDKPFSHSQYLPDRALILEYLEETKSLRSHLAWLTLGISLTTDIAPITYPVARKTTDHSTHFTLALFPLYDLIAADLCQTDASILHLTPSVARQLSFPPLRLGGSAYHLDRHLLFCDAIPIDSLATLDLAGYYEEAESESGFERLLKLTSGWLWAETPKAMLQIRRKERSRSWQAIAPTRTTQAQSAKTLQISSPYQTTSPYPYYDDIPSDTWGPDTSIHL